MAVTRGSTGNARPRVIQPISTSPSSKKRRNAGTKPKAADDTKAKASSSKRGPKPKASTGAGVTKKVKAAKSKVEGAVAKAAGKAAKDPATKKGAKASKKAEANAHAAPAPAATEIAAAS
ncbi:hypothetical protein FQN55_008974 [Onygenales sp. PD_40]|nr:hypothetical protein FQN55_008974 [Onygenales sp. PD_40]